MLNKKNHYPRIVFLGSGPFALPVLEALAKPFNVVAVVTQPDQPSGRGRHIHRGLVAARTEELNLPLLQPASIRASEVLTTLRALEPDLLLVASYGQILSQAVLNLPTRGALNVHPSLLPRWRGPSPVAAAILAGDTVTGVTVIEMVRRMDAGPIVAQRSMPIAEDDTTESLTTKLAYEGATLLLEVLPDWLRGRISAAPQDESLATYSTLLTKEDGRLDWSRPADELARQIRAYVPWPVAYTFWEGRLLRIFRAQVSMQSGLSFQTPPGHVVAAGPEGIHVQTGAGQLLLTEVQLEGRRRMSAAEFVRGHANIAGAQLERER
jgi:methionyl-tRNA formyltransferase